MKDIPYIGMGHMSNQCDRWLKTACILCNDKSIEDEYHFMMVVCHSRHDTNRHILIAIDVCDIYVGISIHRSTSMCVAMFMCILWMYNHWILLNTQPVNTNNPFVLFLFHCVICVTIIHIVFVSYCMFIWLFSLFEPREIKISQSITSVLLPNDVYFYRYV